MSPAARHPDPHATALFRCLACGGVFEDLADTRGWCPWCDEKTEVVRHEVELPRPRPIRLSGCTCGGIGDTGAHRAGCPWGRFR